VIESDYNSLPGVRSTLMKEVWLKSEAHAKYMLDNPDAGRTASRDWLNAVHCAGLEPEYFEGRYSMYKGTRRGQNYEAHMDSHPGTLALNQREWDSAKAIGEAARSHPVAGPMLTGGWPDESEKTVTWTDEETGLKCKAKQDRWIHTMALVGDLKTIGDGDADALVKMMLRMGWHIQLAHYIAGIRAMFPALPKIGAVLICVEQKPPHAVTVLEMDQGGYLLTTGEVERRKLLVRLAECKASGKWPGRYDAPVNADDYLPTWLLPSVGDDEDLDIDTEEAP